MKQILMHFIFCMNLFCVNLKVNNYSRFLRDNGEIKERKFNCQIIMQDAGMYPAFNYKEIFILTFLVDNFPQY